MKTPTAFIAVILLVVFSGRSGAQDTATQPADSSGGDLPKLKHLSSFSMAATRNPFWPIGWVKGDTNVQTTEVAEQPAAPITADKFEVTSISTGVNPMAMINGKPYAEGETITALYGAQRIKILVVAINDGEVVLQYLDRKYTIAMKRPELVHNPTSTDDLLPKKDENLLILR